MGSDRTSPAGPGRKIDTYRRKYAQPSPDEALAALSLHQHAVFGIDQLRGLGFTDRMVQYRVVTRRLFRVHQGVYSLVPPELLTRNGRYMAAVLACGPGAVLSHQSAAVLHGLKDWGGPKIEITVPSRAPRSRDGIQVHRSTTLRPNDTTVIDGIPCTTLARTLVDLADVVNRRGVEIAFDRADQQGELDIAEVQDQLERNCTRPGTPRVRSILDEHYIGSTLAESELEEAAYALCRTLDIPMPETQRWLMLPDGGPALRPDITWVEQRVILEADGDKVHGTRRAREARNVRDQRLLVHAWVPVHASWRQITRRPHELGPTLVRLVCEPARLRARAAPE